MRPARWWSPSPLTPSPLPNPGETPHPSLALQMSSLMLIPAPFLVPDVVPGFVGAPCGVAYGVPAGASSDLADGVTAKHKQMPSSVTSAPDCCVQASCFCILSCLLPSESCEPTWLCWVTSSPSLAANPVCMTLLHFALPRSSSVCTAHCMQLLDVVQSASSSGDCTSSLRENPNTTAIFKTVYSG